ncbi:homocysteine S-methyltransferase family protein [Rosettibacter firmus]|uniref:homocysteine S-methyltransferase family protein n=1 Tax=Rosettibacter firmus TaxID=3111522 RepID=UPI00336BBD25
MKTLIELLKENKILISDGAWGTFLQSKGLQPGECPELWNITHRDVVFEIAKSYVDAGADMILTNSFGANPIKLKHYGLESKTAELNFAAASISREAAGDNHYVLGSIGPTGILLMMGEISEDEIYEGFKIQATALKAGGADAILIETMSDIDEAKLAVKAAKENTNLTVICTFTFEKTLTGEYRTMMGVSPTEMTIALKEAGVDIIGTNCGNGFDQMIEIVQEIRTVDNSIPILVHANAGKPIFKDGITVFPETPDFMASKVQLLIESGANIIGGCCGTTPAHISAIANVVRNIK